MAHLNDIHPSNDGDAAAAPALPAPSTVPIEVEETRTLLGVGAVFPRTEALPERSGVGPVFGSFRPVLGRPDSVEGEQALLEVMRAFDRDRPEPAPEVVIESARLLALASFPDDAEGRELTDKLIQAILQREFDRFGNEDRIRFGAAVGRREFPDDRIFADIQARWVLGSVSPGEHRELERMLAGRGVGLHEIVPGNVWIRGEPSMHCIEEGVESKDIARFLRSRGLSTGFFNPPDPSSA